MPIPVSCRCGKSFAANDNLAGKTVKCPNCQQPLSIPAPAAQGARPQPGAAGIAPAPKATGDGKIAVACACGAKFAAKAELRGKTVKCPKCSRPLVLGAAAPAAKATATVAAGAAAAPAGVAPPASPTPSAGGGFGLDDLLDEVGVKPKATGENACPSCGAFIGPEAVLCVECGYDRKRGKKLEVEKVKKPEVKKLGPPTGAARIGGAGGKPQSSIPWEEAGGDFGSIFATAKAVISEPQEAFAQMRPDGLKLSLGYFFANVLLIGFVVALLFGGAIAALSGGQALGFAAIVGGVAIGYFLIAGSLSLLVYGLVFHGLLKLVGGANKPLRTTMQVLGYCTGAAHLLLLCPILSVLATVIAFYSIPVGMAAAHETSWVKTYIALALYLVLAFVLQFMLGIGLQLLLEPYLAGLAD